ncbi:MAG: hypothetical protein KTR25_10215 [Myxococcales bacterium]|nr:hypothetical protein [Myxococcales bacterium]
MKSTVAALVLPAKGWAIITLFAGCATLPRMSQSPTPSEPPEFLSRIAIFDLASRDVSILLERPGIVEAPNWSRDGKTLLVNADGDLFRLPLEGPPRLEPLALEGGGYVCNNDHDFSPDGQHIAFSAASPQVRQSRVFVARADGSNVQLVTTKSPSYFHGWSPDGQWLVFVAERGDGNFELYRIPAMGGKEERLTSTSGYDDGPEYSPDGRFIYFNSNRGGRWNLWRMPATGAGPKDELAERVTQDEPEDWFPHLSPDGKWLVSIAFPPGTKGHNDRMPGMILRLLPVPGEQLNTPEIPETLLTFSGGQGSLNVNSWAPDSQRFAFVIYERQH